MKQHVYSFQEIVKAVLGFIWPKRDWEAEYVAWRDAPPAMTMRDENENEVARLSFLAGVRAGREIRS